MEQIENAASPAPVHGIVTMPFTAYYSDDSVTVYNMDCRKVLPWLGKFDLLLTDPPFGINRDKGMGGGGFCGKTGNPRTPKVHKGGWDSERPSRAALEAVFDAADKRIIWGGQFFADMLPVRGKWLWWDKQQTMPSYGDGELAWTDLSGDAAKKFTLALNAIIARGETGLHPTQKPVALMEWMLGFLQDAKTVVDPYMGSGTTGVACIRRGLNFVGIEKDGQHFRNAVERIRRELSQERLF